MDRSLIFSFVVVVLVGSASVSHANLPAQIYWHTKLPNTPMPAAIRELLRPDLVDEKPTYVAVGKGGVHVDAGYGKPGGTYVDVGKGGVHVDAGKDKPGGTTVGVGHGRVDVDAGHGHTTVGVGKGGVHVYAGHKGKPVVVHVGKPFNYIYAATADQLHDDPAVALFFLEKDLRPGSEMKLQFYETQPGSTFLPRLVANSIPFSSAKTAAIFKRLSIAPNSPKAEAMKNTLETCESPAANGEEKLCATSLESMVDFATAKLGSHVKAIATEADKDGPRQAYTVEAAAQKMAGAKSVSCHSESYAYAVFFCHETRDTAAYVVPLVGKDGGKVAAVAVCHQDTSKWNPEHVAFRVLKVKPGSVPVCHFLPQDHIVWVPSN